MHLFAWTDKVYMTMLSVSVCVQCVMLFSCEAGGRSDEAEGEYTCDNGSEEVSGVVAAKLRCNGKFFCLPRMGKQIQPGLESHQAKIGRPIRTSGPVCHC